MMSMSKYNTEYVAYCAGRNTDFSTEKRIPAGQAEKEFQRRIAHPEGERIKLSSLKTADDYVPLSTYSEQYHDGPDGPFTRTIIDSVAAFGKVWLRQSYWVDKARDCRETWYMPE